jgi:excinuclease ABC subunit C
VINEIIAEKLKTLPDSSGVYIMLDKNKRIIYIGKARVLKNRVRQYFHSPVSFNDKTLAMVSDIADFDYIITNSEADALALEANLIKKHKPKYNVLLKDDKRFPYISVNLKEDFPAFRITRRIKKDGARYFGPFMGGIRASELLQILGEAYPLKLCGLNLSKIPKSHRPCLNYHLKKCCAPCSGKVKKEDYKKLAVSACNFLKGDYEDIKKALTSKMLSYSESEQYEAAAAVRDRIKMLEKLDVKKVAAMPKKIDIDVFSYFTDGKYSAVSLLIIREGNMEGAKNFSVSDAGLYPEDTLSSFITQYYSQEAPPPLILTDIEINTAALSEYISDLYKKSVNVVIPLKGKNKKLTDMAHKNAEEYLLKYIENIRYKQQLTEGASALLAEALRLEKIPHRIECYDISHISGTDKTASMVVFLGGEKQPALYRRFKIKTVEGSDDFASVAETVRRRFERYMKGDNDESFGSLPDVVVIDGGLGQLHAAAAEIHNLGLEVEIISLAKKNEEIYTLDSNEPVRLPLSSLAVRLLQRIRDESHRFALNYHRKLREKHISSELENIKGIGESKIRELIKDFGSVENIKKASVEELAKTKGISGALAERIYDYFNNKSRKSAVDLQK